MSDPALVDLLARLRALGRAEHDDLSVATEAAELIERWQAAIDREAAEEAERWNTITTRGPEPC